MATTEMIIGQTKDGRIIVYWENVGPTSYATGGFAVSIGTLRTVEKVVSLSNNYGYRSEPGEVSIAGNVITIPCHYHGYACPPACITGWEVTSGQNLSGTKFSGIVIGF